MVRQSTTVPPQKAIISRQFLSVLICLPTRRGAARRDLRVSDRRPDGQQGRARLLFAMLRWTIALTYLGFGLGVAIVAGWVIGRPGSGVMGRSMPKSY